MKLVSRAGAAVLALSVCLAAPAAAAGLGRPAAGRSLAPQVDRRRAPLRPTPPASPTRSSTADRPGRPSSQVWIMNVATGQSTRLGPPAGTASSPRWSADGRFLAFLGSDGQRSGLFVAAADGSNARFIAGVTGTNHPLPTSGENVAWSPDGRRIAYVSATPGPEPRRQRRSDGDHALSLQADRPPRGSRASTTTSACTCSSSTSGTRRCGS